MQESPYFPVQLTPDGADEALPQKPILTGMPQI